MPMINVRSFVAFVMFRQPTSHPLFQDTDLSLASTSDLGSPNTRLYFVVHFSSVRICSWIDGFSFCRRPPMVEVIDHFGFK